MSSEPPSSPSGGPAPSPDEAQLPRGQCRYILLIPELRGQRCACVNFTLSRTLPSATCDCGHLACFHVKDDEAPVDRHEYEKLKLRLEVMEEQFDKERDGSLANIVSQFRDLEEGVTREGEDTSQEIRGLYRNISRIWQSIQQLEARDNHLARASRSSDPRLQAAEAQSGVLSYQPHERAGMREAPHTNTTPERRDSPWTPGAVPRLNRGEGSETTELAKSSHAFAHHHHYQASASREATGAVLSATNLRRHTPESAALANRGFPQATAEPWTVHISLLPDASQPFPFERDTAAYKRCVSRGLHRMAVVNGPSADAFTAIVTKAFGHLLQGRPWMPLQAKLCAAEKLSGLPMLRQLDSTLQDSRFDHEFLRKHCAVCDSRGKIESLYIAMRTGTLSWRGLREAPVYIGGLEASWAHDPVLDQPGPLQSDNLGERPRLDVGDIASTAFKRPAADVSPTSGPGGSGTPADSEGSRKLPRTSCMNGLLDLQLRAGKV